MAVFKCKMCGANLEISEGSSVVACEYCGANQTVPILDDEKKFNLFNRANRLRFNSEFDTAISVYENIVSQFPEESESYWGLVLCHYGIEYVDDPKTGKKVPTCHRTVPASVMDDENFKLACEYADSNAKAVYREEAKAIDRLQQQILSIVQAEEPYDVFICYKETDENGIRTEDSGIAQDIYTELIKEGYRVFFARVTLRDKAGSEYEPYIYSALLSSKVMLAIGTKFEYYDAVWVKNEWSRYLAMMQEDKAKHLIPCYKDIDAYDMPREFKNLQALNMADITFFKSLNENIKRCISPKVSVSNVAANNGASANVDSLLKRAFMFLEDGDWNNANAYCEKVLDIDPENAQAYLGKLLVECKCRKLEDLQNYPESFSKSVNYSKIQRFGDEQLKTALEIFLNGIYERLELERLEEVYQQTVALMSSASTIENYQEAAAEFKKIAQYKDSANLLEACEEAIEKIKYEQEQKRLEKERREKEALEKEIKRVKKRRKILSVVFSIIAVVMAFSIFLTTVIIPKFRFSDIIAVSAGDYHTVGLKSDGTVVAFGDNYVGQCDVDSWTDIIAVSAGDYHTVGLKSDGTVVAIEYLGYSEAYDGQCDVDGWTDIIAVSAGDYHTVGLKSDGTVIAVGDNDDGQCDVDSWTDIIAVSAGWRYTVGLKSDGTVVAVGDNEYGQCDVDDWTDIIAVSAGENHTVGLKSDGTVVAFGDNYVGQCDVDSWTDIIAVSAGDYHTVGLKSDGTVVAVGYNEYGQCDVDDWTDIIAVSAGKNHTVGLKSDGTVVAVGHNGYGQCLVGGSK